jgi:hypothetical protein
VLQAAGKVKKLNLICLTALPLLLAAPGAALAQDDGSPPGGGEDAAAAAAAPEDGREVAFSSDELTYDGEAQIVTASGDVRMNSEGNRLRAERVTWNRATEEVRAEGNVRIVNPAATLLMPTAWCSPTPCATGSSRTCCWCSPTAAASPPTGRSGGTATPPSTGPPIRLARW